MIAVSAGAQRVDFRQLTKERAERVTHALETHYAREGHYPQDLRQLTPGTSSASRTGHHLRARLVL